MGKSSAPTHAAYEQFKDTPWITQGRQIADIGGKGILENYNKVNVFDDATKADLEARNNDVYQRAFSDMNDQYARMMNKYNSANYGQFGTLNATAPYYNTDHYQRDFQRQMNDLAYNKAINYENLINNELQRRYNTLDMFNNLYQYGQTPHQVDLANWNIRNTNKDVAYQNAAANYMNNNSGGLGGMLQGVAQGAISGGLATGSPWGALAGGVMGGIGGYM